MNGVFSIPACCSLGPPRCCCVQSGRFLSGPENQPLAWAVERVAAESGAYLRPLVICGGTGTGKSLLLRHLAERAVNLCRGSSEAGVVVQLTAHQWIAAYSAAHADRRLAEWRQQMRDARWLIVDELDALVGHRTAQEELARTLDELALSLATVVVASRVTPMSLPLVCTGLLTRLSGGLVISIEPPSRAVCDAVARAFALSHRLRLTDEAIDWLAELPAESLGQLVARLATTSEFCGDRTILDRMAVEQFWTHRSAHQLPSLAEITRATARQFGVRLTEVRGPGRQRSVVLARGVAMYLARTNLDLSLEEIGHYFSGRDHSTVLHQCHKLAGLYLEDAALGAAVNLLAEQLGLRSNAGIGKPDGCASPGRSVAMARSRRRPVPVPSAGLAAPISTSADNHGNLFSTIEAVGKPQPK